MIAHLLAALPTDAALPESQRDQLLALGAAAVPALTKFVASWPGSGEDDHARGHATDLLVELRAVEGIPTLLRVFIEYECPIALYDHLRDGLPRFGAELVAPALELLAGRTARNERYSICWVLSRLGVREDRILHALLDHFAEDRRAATLLAEYGDPAALPHIREAIERFSPNPVSLPETGVIHDLIEAFDALGGESTDDLAVRATRWQLQAEATLIAWDAASLETSRYRAARKAVCPCGSGNRYGDCCAACDSAAFDEVIRRKLPRLELLAFAQPLLDECRNVLAKLDAIRVAEVCERIALLGEGPAQQRAIDEMLASFPDGELERGHRAARVMLGRYYALFPDLKPNSKGSDDMS